MPASNQHITAADEWFVAEDKALTFTVRDGAGTAQDISGWSLRWQLRLTRSNPTALITKVTGVGTQIVLAVQSGPTLGQFTVDIDEADTSTLKAGTYHYAAKRTNAGFADVVIEGDAVLLKSGVA